MDRHILDRIAQHVREDTVGDEPGTRRQKFVGAVRHLAKTHAAHEHLRMYELLAKDLPTAARSLGFMDYSDTKTDPAELAESIELVLKDIQRGKHYRLIPAFIQWMCLRDTEYATLFLDDIGFDIGTWLSAVENAAGRSTHIAGIQASSPYNLENALSLAEHRLVLVAQNHWHMIAERHRGDYKYWPLILNALSRGVSVEIVAMHPMVGPSGGMKNNEADWPDAISLWSHHMSTPIFPAQIDEFWRTMQDWEQRYRSFAEDAEIEPGDFTVFGAYFTPLTMTLIDPDSHEGAIILSPRTLDPKSTMRPQFVVRKRTDPAAFAYYYADVAHALVDHYWVRMIG